MSNKQQFSIEEARAVGMQRKMDWAQLIWSIFDVRCDQKGLFFF